MRLKFACKFVLYFLDNSAESQTLSVSTNHGSSSPVLYTVNETVTINLAVDLSHDFDQYFGKSYYLHVYNGRWYTLYSASISNTDYWTGAFTIRYRRTFNSALIKIVLFHTYSPEFLFKCISYYNIIGPLISYTSIIQDQVYLKINYYGESHICLDYYTYMYVGLI